MDVLATLDYSGSVNGRDTVSDLRERVCKVRSGQQDRGVFAHVIHIRGSQLDISGNCRYAFFHLRPETGGDGNGYYYNKERDSYGDRSYPSLKLQTFRYETCGIHLTRYGLFLPQDGTSCRLP